MYDNDKLKMLAVLSRSMLLLLLQFLYAIDA